MLPKAPLANGLTNTRKNASIDLYDRSAVAALNSDYINTDLAISTLNTALEKENYPKVILHSDQGDSLLHGNL